ncbi:hypothetical protein [Telmatospirillum sp.]|uniref:hypothetical protein n=1 Tax=Telmatospirillum sp. TaxID=2079197 RepID=UPI00284CF642|nr:hypothetical protein [Telmatospirillum sp.]MDR3435825.1 hypothetical protein [Telmatospirillum sp.]
MKASQSERSPFFRWAIWLSVLLHALLVLVLLDEDLPWSRLTLAEPPPIEIDLVPPPSTPEAKQQPKPKAPETKPPEPPPAQQPPEPKPPEPPDVKREESRKPEPVPQRPPPLTQPQLQPGRIAQKSSVPHPSRNGAEGTTSALAMSSGPGVTLIPKEQAKAGRAGATGPEGPELTQSEQDFVLSQVMKYWHVDFHAPEARGLTMEGVFFVQADGTLMSPVNKNDPWNPSVVVEDYPKLGRYQREAVDGFLLALRLCQPLELPSSKGPWPRKVVIRFAFDQL